MTIAATILLVALAVLVAMVMLVIDLGASAGAQGRDLSARARLIYRWLMAGCAVVIAACLLGAAWTWPVS